MFPALGWLLPDPTCQDSCLHQAPHLLCDFLLITRRNLVPECAHTHRYLNEDFKPPSWGPNPTHSDCSLPPFIISVHSQKFIVNTHECPPDGLVSPWFLLGRGSLGTSWVSCLGVVLWASTRQGPEMTLDRGVSSGLKETSHVVRCQRIF